MKAHRSTLFLVLGLLLGWCGCSMVAPETAALHRVHEAYRREFSELRPQDPGAPAAPVSTNLAPPPPSFSATFEAIREFRRRFGTDSTESAHLQVLEGMIYLQSERPGMARALQPAVREQLPRLHSASGKKTRDEMFAENYPHLVDGWGEITRYVEARRRNAGAAISLDNLVRAADGIHHNLALIDPKDLPDAEADQGGLYLAATAATFYAWASHFYNDPRNADREEKRREWLGRGRELVRRYLTEAEKLAIRSDPNAHYDAGRWRYVRWYQWLTDQLQ